MSPARRTRDQAFKGRFCRPRTGRVIDRERLFRRPPRSNVPFSAACLERPRTVNAPIELGFVDEALEERVTLRRRQRLGNDHRFALQLSRALRDRDDLGSGAISGRMRRNGAVTRAAPASVVTESARYGLLVT